MAKTTNVISVCLTTEGKIPKGRKILTNITHFDITEDLFETIKTSGSLECISGKINRVLENFKTVLSCKVSFKKAQILHNDDDPLKDILWVSGQSILDLKVALQETQGFKCI